MRAGLEVLVREASAEAAEAGRARLVTSFDRGLTANKMTEDERDASMERLSFTTDIGELSDRDLVVEAIIEDEDMKVDLFRELDQVLTNSDAILASNTSSIPIMKLGTATSAQSRSLGFTSSIQCLCFGWLNSLRV